MSIIAVLLNGLRPSKSEKVWRKGHSQQIKQNSLGFGTENSLHVEKI